MTIPKNKNELKKIIEDEIKLHGRHCDLNHIDTSSITDMSYLFCYSGFNGDISRWNVSNVNNMHYMFAGSKFNGDISTWDVSNVTDMNTMFYCSEFNGNISKWDVSNVIDMSYMFFNSQFDAEKNNLNDWQPMLANIKNIFYSDYIKNKPYWANYEDIKEREGASNNYKLKKNLDNDLNDKNYNKTKIKI